MHIVSIFITTPTVVGELLFSMSPYQRKISSHPPFLRDLFPSLTCNPPTVAVSSLERTYHFFKSPHAFTYADFVGTAGPVVFPDSTPTQEAPADFVDPPA
jgi:hypothetical protein